MKAALYKEKTRHEKDLLSLDSEIAAAIAAQEEAQRFRPSLLLRRKTNPGKNSWKRGKRRLPDTIEEDLRAYLPEKPPSSSAAQAVKNKEQPQRRASFHAPPQDPRTHTSMSPQPGGTPMPGRVNPGAGVEPVGGDRSLQTGEISASATLSNTKTATASPGGRKPVKGKGGQLSVAHSRRPST